MSLEHVKKLAKDIGGTIHEVGRLPDGSGFATMSMPPPKNHWLLANPGEFNVPPMPLRMGTANALREPMRQALIAAGRYALRCATMNGREMDFDPDALLQNLVVGMIGYHTPTGLSSDKWANPKEP